MSTPTEVRQRGNAVIYAVAPSSPGGTSVESQVTEALRLAVTKGWTVVGVFTGAMTHAQNTETWHKLQWLGLFGRFDRLIVADVTKVADEEGKLGVRLLDVWGMGADLAVVGGALYPAVENWALYNLALDHLHQERSVKEATP